MLVYGERLRVIEPRAALGRIADGAREVVVMPAGLARHAALAGTFLELAALVQGLADGEFEAAGQDDVTPLQAAGMAAMAGLAAPLAASWRAGLGGGLRIDPAPLQALGALPLPEQVLAKTPEGFAFYAVYPEAYAQAAAGLERPAMVIGLRSIGVALAAMAAAASGGAPPVTVRPTGHPFRRELRLSPALQDRLSDAGEGPIVVVDEGPGLSGSSFGAVGDWLEGRGVRPERLVFMPGHQGEPGPMASAAHRQRWRRTRRRVCEFDELALSSEAPGRRLEHWVEDIVGPASAPLQDLSGGAWRALRGHAAADWPPAHAGQERRKFLLQTADGRWLLKFAGLGRTGREKFDRARRLGQAGFTPAPLGLRHGFLVEPWLRGKPLDGQVPQEALLDALGRYLAFRARVFPARAQDGAGQAELEAMIEANTQEGLGADVARRLKQRFPAAPLTLRPMRVDGRLHRWEWLVTPDGRLLKTDAVDHDDAHDLIGCQDVAWDLAGAEAEFDLSEREMRLLAEAVGRGGRPVSPETLAFMRLAYAAFQLGLWSNALAAAEGEERARIAPLPLRYARRLEVLART